MLSRILYCSRADLSLPNGPSVNETEFLGALGRIPGIDVVAVVPRPTHPISLPQGVRFHQYRTTGRGAIYHGVAQLTQPWALVRAVRQFQPDALVLRTQFPFGLYVALSLLDVPLFIKTLEPPRLTVLEDGTKLPRSLGKLLNAANRIAMTQLMRRALVIDTVTEQCLYQLRKLQPPADGGKLVHIDNATNPERFVPLSRPVARARTGVWPDGIVIGYAGGRPVECGGRHIVRCIKRHLHAIPTLRGVVIGCSDQEIKALAALATQLAVADRVLFVREVPYVEVVDWINAFDIGVALDTPERLAYVGNSNQKIRQYLCCGIPVIAAAGTAGFIEQNDLGVLVGAASQPAFDDAIATLTATGRYRDDGERSRLRRFAVEHFSIDSAVQRRLNLWTAAIESAVDPQCPTRETAIPRSP